MARTRVIINHRGIAKLLKGSAAEKACRPRIERVLAAAESAAPVGETGDYRDSLHIEEVTHPTRKVWRVVADVPYAMKVEANYGVLARALAEASGLVRYTSKSGKVSMITQAQADNYSRNKR